MTAIMPDVNEAALSVLEALAAASGDPSAALGNPTDPTDPAGATQPMITVVKGNPDDVELAALVAVISVAAAQAAKAEKAEISKARAETWGHPTLMHRHATPFSPEAYWVNPQLRA